MFVKCTITHRVVVVITIVVVEHQNIGGLLLLAKAVSALMFFKELPVEEKLFRSLGSILVRPFGTLQGVLSYYSVSSSQRPRHGSTFSLADRADDGQHWRTLECEGPHREPDLQPQMVEAVHVRRRRRLQHHQNGFLEELVLQEHEDALQAHLFQSPSKHTLKLLSLSQLKAQSSSVNAAHLLSTLNFT